MPRNQEPFVPKPNLTLENVRLIFKNFKGAKGKFNDEGQRSFNVVLDDEMAEVLKMDGWNVKEVASRDEDGSPMYILPVKVAYKGRPPRIVMVTNRGKTNIDEDTVALLDFADLLRVDLVIRPYHYDVNGNQGISAYLKTMYATINEDELEMKYAEPNHEEEE